MALRIRRDRMKVLSYHQSKESVTDSHKIAGCSLLTYMRLNCSSSVCGKVGRLQTVNLGYNFKMKMFVQHMSCSKAVWFTRVASVGRPHPDPFCSQFCIIEPYGQLLTVSNFGMCMILSLIHI